MDKIVILEKRALRLMYFADYKSRGVPLYVNCGILPFQLLYFKSVASLLHDIDNQLAPRNISLLFTRSKQIHSYPTRSEIPANFYVEISRISQWLFSFSRIGTKTRNGICSELRRLRKTHFRRKLNKLFLKFLKIGRRMLIMARTFGHCLLLICCESQS